MRSAFIKGLLEAAKTDKSIFLLTGDLGYRFLEPFRDAYPDRFLNVGVAEANLVTAAAGLATAGYTPVIYSIATFMTMRPYEQIRDDIVLQHLNVKLVGIGGGLAYAMAGPTHHSLEDISLMRTFASMTIIVPTEPTDAYKATKAMVLQKGPVYLRLERNPEQTVTTTAQFTIGKANQISRGKSVCLMFTGTKRVLSERIAAILYEKKGLEPTIVAFPTVRPLDKKLVLTLGKSHQLLVTLEEHLPSGGFGSEILETISDSIPSGNSRVIRVGIPGHSHRSAGYHTLCSQAGFTPEAIAKRICLYLP